MSEDELSVDMVLPRHRVRQLRTLQRATYLFDRMATLPRQGRISEVELRLFLATEVGWGGRSNDNHKLI